MPATPTQTLAADLLDRLDALILDAERQTKPLELEPYRSQLFELFVIADASGLMRDDSVPDLSPEGLFFINKKDSPNGTPLLVMSHDISNTVTTFEVVKDLE